MMSLQVGQRAAFRASGGRVTITGKVVALHNGVYLVAADNGLICHAYPDGLFRFTEWNIVRHP